MSEKTLKTSEAQRRAVERYREKVGNNYKTFSITLPKDEHERNKKTLEKLNKKPVDVWRAGIATLETQDE